MTLGRIERYQLKFSKRILPELRKLQKRVDKGERPLIVQVGGVSGSTILLPTPSYMKREILRRQKLIKKLEKVI